MSERLSADQRKIMQDGRALVVHCDDCQAEMFLAELPLDASELTRITRRAKCATDAKHRLFMGPPKAREA